MGDCYCTKSELDLFVSQPIQLAIDRSSFVEIHPVASISDSSSIEFLISGLGTSYYDLSHVFLHVQAKVLKDDGTQLAATDKCIPVNYILNTMFSECHVSLNDRQISSDNNYAYKAIMQALLLYPESAQINLLSAGLFYKDDIGKYEGLDPTAANANDSLKQRWNRTKASSLFDLYGALHLDLGTQPKLLINGVSVRIKLEKAKNAFSLLADTGSFKLHIENASLFVRRCEISGSILVGHEKALERSLVQMPFTRTEIKTFTLSTGLKSVTIPNAVNGPLPSRMILTMVSNSAFNGDLKKNPFHFKHYSLNHISLSENGVQIPATAYVPNFEKNVYARNYMSLFTDLAKHDTNIKYDEYKDLCFYVFDLTQDFSASDPFSNVLRSGDLSVQLRFEKDLPETVTLLVYLEMQSLIEIDKSRNVFTDF